MKQNKSARVVYRSYAPDIIITHVPTYKPWQFAACEIIAMAVIGYVIFAL